MSASVNHEKLHQELKAAGLPVVGVSESGRVDYSRDLTSAEKELAQATLAAHDPSATDTQVFFQQLRAAGISRDEVLRALFIYNTEGDTFLLTLISEKIK